MYKKLLDKIELYYTKFIYEFLKRSQNNSYLHQFNFNDNIGNVDWEEYKHVFNRE